MRFEDETYMVIAYAMAENSHARRKKVGAVLVTPQGVLLTGYNGTVSGTDNNCETEEEEVKFIGSGRLDAMQVAKKLTTKPDVLHAEQNCLIKAAREGVSTLGSKIYITMSPCNICAPMIAQAGVVEVIYAEEYRDTSGISLLQSYGVQVRQYNGENSD